MWRLPVRFPFLLSHGGDRVKGALRRLSPALGSSAPGAEHTSVVKGEDPILWRAHRLLGGRWRAHLQPCWTEGFGAEWDPARGFRRLNWAGNGLKGLPRGFCRGEQGEGVTESGEADRLGWPALSPEGRNSGGSADLGLLGVR